jgi:ornithine--oxo-acid transaminase
MNSIIRRFSKQSFNLNNLSLSKLFVNTNLRLISNTLGAKKLPTAGKASGAGNKVENVSTKKSKSKALDFEEEVEEPEEKVAKTSKKKNVSVSPAKNTEVSKNKSASKTKEVKKEAPKKEATRNESPKKEAPKKEASKNESSKKEAPKKEAPKKEAPRSESPKKVATKKKVSKQTTSSSSSSSDSAPEEVVIKKASIKSPQKAAHTLNTKPAAATQQPEKAKEETKPEEEKPKKRSPPKKKSQVNEDPLSTENPEVDLNNIGRVKLETDLDPKKYTTNPRGLYVDYIESKCSPVSRQLMEQEREVLCQNYAPLPVVCHKGKGVYLQDVDGHIYIDFLSAYSAVNQGHVNTNIIKPAYEQMMKLHMTSRAFYNDVLYKAARLVTQLFAYEKVLFMNSGAEAGESAVKIARRWSYVEKGLPDDTAKIIFAKGNFWGRSLYACATSDDPSRYYKFGPFQKDTHYMVEFGKIEEIRNLLETDKHICAVFLEPIQGENGVLIPPPGYLTEVSKLCKEHNVLFIADEIQTGIGRAGYLLASQMENVHPDMVLLAKSLSGGLYPISAVLASKKVMDTIKPGEHGSTFGGNPLAAELCCSALQEMINKSLIMNSFYRGVELGLILKEELEKNRLVKEVRGRGLMYAIELWPECGFDAYDMSIWLMERGILCKPTKQFTLR